MAIDRNATAAQRRSTQFDQRSSMQHLVARSPPAIDAAGRDTIRDAFVVDRRDRVEVVRRRGANGKGVWGACRHVLMIADQRAAKQAVSSSLTAATAAAATGPQGLRHVPSTARAP
jgi:hypothetical protein